MTDTPSLNPSYLDVKIGDQYSSGQIFILGKQVWSYISTVINIQDVSTRFGKPDRIVTVKTVTPCGNVIDERKAIWVSQLLQGLV
jgi:hypothetical protein